MIKESLFRVSFFIVKNNQKYEIAQEFGVQLGAETSSRANGSVGGEITKRLVAMAEQQLGGGYTR
ncbi:small, acid-soluble spore protein, alpha/beta type [Bacillus toyonensis]|uniref:small, acid-soluble spore protein, alpha/beta type n=1 Tax=Bacillus toyonensis TaxID=155322 RepID=UPI003EBE3816